VKCHLVSILCGSYCANRRLLRSSSKYAPWLSSRYPPRARPISPAGRDGESGARTVSLAGKVALPRPFDTFMNAMPGPYVPGERFAALVSTLNAIATPFVSAMPEVELAVSQAGVLIE
jgi:hypothetical protein